MKPEDMTVVLKLAHDRGIYVVSDECYVYLNYTGIRSRRDVSAKSRASDHHRLALEDIRDDRLAARLCARPGAHHQCDAEAAEPEHVEPDIHRAKGGRSRLSGSQECVERMRDGYISLRDKVIEDCARFPESPVRCRRERFTPILTSVIISIVAG